MECREEHFIEMELIGTEKEQRAFGFEYEYTYRGGVKCTHCGEEMQLWSLIYEYPKGQLNYVDIDNESCLVMDDMKEDNFIITK